MKKLSLFIFFFLLTFSTSIKTKKKTSKKNKNLSIESVDFESLCSNLKEGFAFNLNLDQASKKTCKDIDNVVYLENVLDPSIRIEATCSVQTGDDYAECETTESAKEEGTYKINIDTMSAYMTCGGILNGVNAEETVVYSKDYSNVDLDTENQNIDYNKKGPYSFYIDFIDITSNSKTKIYYEEYENNDLIEIEDCSKSDNRITCNVTPETVPCDYGTCNYNIVVEDDCGLQQESILLSITAPTKAQNQQNSQSTQQQQTEKQLLKVTSIDYDSLCSNLQTGFEFYLNLDGKANDSCELDEKIELVNTEDPSIKISTECYINQGSDYLSCKTTDSTDEKGDYKLSPTNENIKLSCFKKNIYLEPFSLNDEVSYSKSYSNVDLETIDQTIDFGEEGPYQFYINFLHLDSNSNTKIYYEDYENNDLIEIEGCSKSDNRITCNVTPETVPCDYATCNYNIVVKDDCGIEQDSILLKIIANDEDDDNNTYYNQNSANVNDNTNDIFDDDEDDDFDDEDEDEDDYDDYYYYYPNTKNPRQTSNKSKANTYDNYDTDNNGKNIKLNMSLILLILSILF